ncbi:putative cytoplasmic protein [Candidatus Burkholderia brachyanthoides]|nr:putative cytoplasmic protein [Candidatus Burkholderia brachyanthoides]
MNEITMDPHDLQRLVTMTMPYGKYKDHVLADLSSHYLAWFAREGFPQSKLDALLALMHEIDHNNLRALLDLLRGR